MMMFFSYMHFFHICINFFKLLVDIDFRLVHFITDFRLVDRFSAFYVCCILCLLHFRLVHLLSDIKKGRKRRIGKKKIRRGKKEQEERKKRRNK